MTVRKFVQAVIMGPPGSGKGTIAKRIVKDFGMKHIASGDVLRKHVGLKTELGAEASDYIAAGQLVPDKIITRLMLAELSDPELLNSHWLVDGFPRTIRQSESLLEQHKPDIVLNLDVPFDEIINRVKDRYIHEGSGRIYNLVFNPPRVAGQDDVTGEPLIQRHDDKEETVRERLRIYQDKTQPLLDYFSKHGLLASFSGRESNLIWPLVHKELSRHCQPLQYTEYK